jgi:hypothetical protein
VQQAQEGEDVAGVGALVVRVVGGGRGLPGSAPGADQRLQAHVVHRLLEALAHLDLDACVEVVRPVGMAERHRR